MKKNVLTLMAIATIITVACQKQNPTPVLNSTTSSSKENTKIWDQVKSNGEPMAVSKWFDYGGSNFGCSGDPVNCLEEVVITPSLATDIEDLSSANDQADFADKHYSSLKTAIDTYFLDKIVNGVVTVKLKGTISTSSIGYLRFDNSAGTVVAVYPYSL
jgi:hypothetical protein